MDLWFTEKHSPNSGLTIKVERQICSVKSQFQRIDIFESREFGRFLTLDGYMMLTEKDEFIYHEMICHPAMALRPDARNVLVIGAGDGGVARELSRYQTIETIDVVEIDKAVVEACKKHLPLTAKGFSDPRVRIFFEDGVKFARRAENSYDVIIIDSTDPFGPGEGLFTREFYGSCYAALRENGVMTNQNESPFYENDARAMARAHSRIRANFPVAKLYQAHIPTYPSGYWFFGFASKGLDPVKDLDADRWNSLGIQTKYYNTDLHVGAFALPNYVREMLQNAEK